MKDVVVVDSPRRAEAFRRAGLTVVKQGDAGPGGVIVNWAAHRVRPPQWQGAFVLNRPEAVELASDRDVRRMLWRYFGLKQSSTRFVSHWYRVHVFDCRIVAIYRGIRRASRRRFQRLPRGGDKELERVGEAAFRALHALRLDFGVVDIARRGDSFVVVDLNLTPPVRGPIAEAYAAAISQFFNRWHQPPKMFLLGADPEFIIQERREKKLVVASRYLPRYGRIGVDSQRIRGTHAARPIVEVRPPPSWDPAALSRSLGVLLRALPRALRRRGLGWYAGSGPLASFPTGGHIHFGGLPLSAGLIRALDSYVALPVLLIEDPERARRRRRKYGSLGEFRRKRWGFEYRTLPSWLVAPRFAEAVISLAKLVGIHWRELRADPFLHPPLVRDFYLCRKADLYEWFDRIWADIQSLPDFQVHAGRIGVIPQLIQHRLRWNEQRDFRREWGVY